MHVLGETIYGFIKSKSLLLVKQSFQARQLTAGCSMLNNKGYGIALFKHSKPSGMQNLNTVIILGDQKFTPHPRPARLGDKSTIPSNQHISTSDLTQRASKKQDCLSSKIKMGER